VLIEAQEEDNPTLHIVAAFLLYDGRNSKDDAIFEMMHSESTFPRLVELVQSNSVQEETKLHQMLLELLYESSRVQRLTWEDFGRSSDTLLVAYGADLSYLKWPWTMPSYCIFSTSSKVPRTMLMIHTTTQ
jgi:hypothetical protein